MNKIFKRTLYSLVALLTLLLISVYPAFAQSRSVFWNAWDVTIDGVDAASNQFRVTETHDVSFTGSFSYGSAYIELDRVEDIRNVTLSQDGRAMSQSCGRRAGTFCTGINEDGAFEIIYYFFEPITNGRAKFEISYDVVGAIRVYEGGDQLWWDAVPSEHYGFSIGESTIRVQLPTGYAPREEVDPVVTYGVPADVQVDGTNVVASARETITGNEMFSIRVQMPHNPDARKPSWQDSFDQQRAFDENVKPFLNIGVVALSALIGLGGLLFIITRYLTAGRDPVLVATPEYLSEPPGNLPPALVGGLVDEIVDLRDIMSTLLDLATRGYIVIEENHVPGPFGIGTTSQFTYKRTDKPASDLRPYEHMMLDKIFVGNAMSRNLESMRNVFYTVIPTLKSQVYDELVSEGFFSRSPNTTRQMWSGCGGLLLVASIALGVLLLFLVDVPVEGILCLPIALGVVGVAALLAAKGMPVKTLKGAEESAKWRAFEQYLRNLQRYDGVQAAASQFDRYMPYAVAFGMSRSWMRQFEAQPNVFIPTPVWYFPTYRGGYWAGGYQPGTPLPSGGVPGELARAGGGGLEDLSQGLGQGLESLSSGLTTMLETASQVMTSVPQPKSTGSGSWSRGGGGFSGGGFSGGGGSGGGGRGFG